MKQQFRTQTQCRPSEPLSRGVHLPLSALEAGGEPLPSKRCVLKDGEKRVQGLQQLGHALALGGFSIPNKIQDFAFKGGKKKKGLLLHHVLHLVYCIASLVSRTAETHHKEVYTETTVSRISCLLLIPVCKKHPPAKAQKPQWLRKCLAR